VVADLLISDKLKHYLFRFFPNKTLFFSRSVAGLYKPAISSECSSIRKSGWSREFMHLYGTWCHH